MALDPSRVPNLNGGTIAPGGLTSILFSQVIGRFYIQNSGAGDLSVKFTDPPQGSAARGAGVFVLESGGSMNVEQVGIQLVHLRADGVGTDFDIVTVRDGGSVGIGVA